ncbi:hypothetical protein [Undibacterium sp. RuTC16W]|uniref:hypothetical protein n=1 Tax=Undibacterium sp. RuTC16W TaxID=3413048 RepID=UPI003BF2BFF4
MDSYTSKNSNNCYLSCDNIDDAIRSLATFYKVKEELIIEVYQQNWPDFLGPGILNSEFTHEHFNWLMHKHVGAKNEMCCVFPAAYYHRSLYDGKPSWFDNGLLNSLDGSQAFLDKLYPHISNKKNFDFIAERTRENILTRTCNEGFNGGGPHAFDRFDDARNAQISGLDYSVPEFFLHRTGKCEITNEFINICKKHLIPVVVKFVGKPSNAENYISNLWHYLYSRRFQIPLEPLVYTFVGRNESIKSGQILELLNL